MAKINIEYFLSVVAIVDTLKTQFAPTTGERFSLNHYFPSSGENVIVGRIPHSFTVCVSQFKV